MINLFQAVRSTPGYFKQLSCKDLLFTQYDCPQIRRKESFFNEHNFISYILKGKRIFQKGKSAWVMDEGKAAFVKKGSYIAEKEFGDDWCVMVFFIPDSYIAEFVKENHSSFSFRNLPEINDDLVLPLTISDTSEAFFGGMLPYFSQEPPPQESLLELKFKELLFTLLGTVGNSHLLAYCKALSNNKRQSIQQVMEDNFTSNLSMEQYAMLACKSLATFKREFKKIFSVPPGKWIINKRLIFAADLLQSSEMSIREVAFESGFENPTHFSRVFKELHGHSPLQYRLSRMATESSPKEMRTGITAATFD